MVVKKLFSFALLIGLMTISINTPAFFLSCSILIEMAKSSTFCDKGSNVKTIRSLEGLNCAQPCGAALAKIICSGVVGFNGSGCDKKISLGLKGTSEEQVMKQESANLCRSPTGYPPKLQVLAYKYCKKP